MVNEVLSALILAIIQGFTEWFPVSSSGHLVLFEEILGYKGGLLFDVALHFGTLMAVFVYFGKDITDIVRDVFLGKWKSGNGRLGILLIIGSIPAAIVGFLVKNVFESVFSSLIVVVFGFGITGLFLIIASFPFVGNQPTHPSTSYKEIKINEKRFLSGRLGYGKAFLIGIAQAFAIVPGISRSGATISSGVLLGLNEKEAMKFAFLLSIPVIFGANILAIGNQTLPPSLIWATLVSFIVGLLSIHVVFKYVLTKRKNFRWFAIYCLVLALAIGVWLVIF